MEVPAALLYSEDHEWVAIEGERARIGLTDFAQQALGDVVFVGLPELGTSVQRGDLIGEVESTKAVSELYSPVSGQVSEVNDELTSHPAALNSEPYGAGWICVIHLADGASPEDLLSASDYETLTAN